MIFRANALLLVLAAILPGPARTHEGHDHPPVPAQAVFPAERLSPPDLPVTDRFGTTKGFVSRYGGAPMLVVSFTYASCGTVCPLSNAVLAEVQGELTAAGARIVSLSIDPARDTPALMSASAEQFSAGPSWEWVAGSVPDTRLLMTAFGVPVGPPEAHVPTILVGSLSSGQFTRVVGIPDPASLLAIAGAEAR